jgi:hypothetical protein
MGRAELGENVHDSVGERGSHHPDCADEPMHLKSFTSLSERLLTEPFEIAV